VDTVNRQVHHVRTAGTQKYLVSKGLRCLHSPPYEIMDGYNCNVGFVQYSTLLDILLSLSLLISASCITTKVTKRKVVQEYLKPFSDKNVVV
jgi:hypothetical protein